MTTLLPCSLPLPVLVLLTMTLLLIVATIISANTPKVNKFLNAYSLRQTTNGGVPCENIPHTPTVGGKSLQRTASPAITGLR